MLAAAAATIPDVTDADLLAAIRVGIGTVQAAGYAPNAVLLNPADWADLDIAVMGATLARPDGRQTFWGLRPIPATVPARRHRRRSATSGPRSQHYYRLADRPVHHRQPRGHVPVQRVHAAGRAPVKTVVVRPQALVEAKTA